MGCNFPETQLRDWLDQGAVQLDEHVAVCPRCRRIVERLRASGGSVDPSAPTASQAIIDSPARIPIGAVTGRIGHYRLKRLIASGAMGTTYEAVQEQPRRTVALKVMKHGVTSRALLRRFEQESQILARLRHPNIVEVYEAGVHEAPGVDGEPEPTPYFAMEYIPNAKHITHYALQKKLSRRQRIELFVKVCDAVHHGHGKGIIHRDLKPSNLLVDSSGEPRVIDFGVARTTDSDLVAVTMQTDVGQPIGTLAYMSPEQCDADPHDIDARSDVYGLGVVLFELLTGELPYARTRTSAQELSRAIRETPPTRPRRLDASIEGDLEIVLLEALQKDRHRRYQSAAELGGDLQRYLAGEPIMARGDSIAYVAGKRLKRQIRRHQFSWWAAAVAAAVLAANFVGIPLIFDWTRLNVAYQRLLLPAVTPMPEGLLESVRVVLLREETDIAAIAAAEQLEGVRPAQARTYRRLYGRLMERLAESGVRVVAFDIAFEATDEDLDRDFLHGVRALREQDIGVVVGTRSWMSPQDPGYPNISDIIYPEVDWGCMTAGMGPNIPWRLHLALQRGENEPLHGFATAIIGAYDRPAAEFEIGLRPDESAIELEYYTTRPGVSHRASQPPSKWIDVTAVRPETTDETDSEIELDAAAVVAHLVLDMPEDRVLEASTVWFEDVFTATPEQLRRWFQDRVVIVQNLRGRGDYRDHPGNRQIPGVYGHAVGVNAVISDLATNRRPRFVGALAIAGAVAGGLIGVWRPGRHGQRIAMLLAATAAAFAVSLVLQKSFQVLGNPMVPILAMFIASELVAGVRRLRPSTC